MWVVIPVVEFRGRCGMLPVFCTAESGIYHQGCNEGLCVLNTWGDEKNPRRGRPLLEVPLRLPFKCQLGRIHSHAGRPATACRLARPAQAPAQAALDQGGPGHGRIQQRGPARPTPGKEPLRPKVRGGSSSLLLALSSLLCFGPQAHQPRSGRAGQRHPWHTSHGGDGPSDRSEEARVSPLPRLERPRGGPGGIRTGVTRQPLHTWLRPQDPMAAGAGRAAPSQSLASHQSTGPRGP
ncbi:hypothetical protein NDU88_000739 [Pleurodeles waltl]|uniref:Uncharacterized protein n=1 Tax=Pleurodeles waltl TaxID=8319 RepID=A0AAV7Q153_PLEWA|nr:hypothetical protein NDU88_000739 [Pleurodeles waltl]